MHAQLWATDSVFPLPFSSNPDLFTSFLSAGNKELGLGQVHAVETLFFS